MENESLYSRTVSAFPISVGTSLALESLFDSKNLSIDPERKFEHIDVNQFSEIWINVSTLFRNIVSAASKESFMMATEQQVLNVLVSEIEIINDLFQNEGRGVCKPIYYTCSYKKLSDELAKAKINLRPHKTDLQKHYVVKHDKVLQMFNKQTEELRVNDSTLSGNTSAKAMIMTHVPYDLLSYRSFSQLSLLESHTGKLKNRPEWNSKYFPVPEHDMSKLPFNKMLLLVFGDKIQIQPSPFKLRVMLLDISVKRNWTPFTSIDKIKQDISLDIKEPYVLEWLKKLV